MFEGAATRRVTGIVSGLFEAPEVIITEPSYTPGAKLPILIACTTMFAAKLLERV